MFTHQKVKFGGTVPNPAKPTTTDIKEQLRATRKKKCFEVLCSFNPMWYQRLTQSQRADLENWYNAWLDVTETLVIPTPPDWLNKSLGQGEEELW